MSDPNLLSDALLERLRARVAEPARRVDRRPSQFDVGVATLDFGQLLGQVRQAGADLARVVQANRSGTVDPELHAKAVQIGSAMTTPVARDLPPPASAASFGQAEARLGFALPGALRQLYAEIADGGFGPGSGLLSIEAVVQRFGAVQREVPRSRSWPARVLPLVDDDPALDCLDASTAAGPVLTWDPDGLSERASESTWTHSFREAAPSLQAWLEAWLGSPTVEERTRDLVRKAMIDQAGRSRAFFAAMTPEQRAGHGLPEVGWEAVLDRRLGLAPDDDPA